MTIHIELVPMLALAAGIGALVAPRQIGVYIIAAFLIAYGVLGLLR